MKTVRSNWLSRLGIVVIAALLVAAISVVQYQRLRSIMDKERDIRSHMVLRALSNRIVGVLDLAEATMAENLLYLKRSLDNPDSVFKAMEYLIDDNPHILGGCIAFIPYYYPSKGRLFEPYAVKEGGAILTRQIADTEHDYTKNRFFIRALETGKADWSDPYVYGADSTWNLTTYSYPVMDERGRIIAVCGLDIDLSWMGEMLNATQHFASSFGLILTEDGTLVAGPPPSRASAGCVEKAMTVLREGEGESSDGELAVRSIRMDRDPNWQIVQVYKTDEVFADMRRIRRQQLFLILLALAILFFMIQRYARNERKLREATAEQARIGAELSVAGKIQQEMLPKAFPDHLFGTVEPAREVGGDLFDFYRRDGKLFFCIGDVSGKGVPAAMLMSVIHSLFRMVSMREGNPARILRALNDQICTGNDSNMFVTFFTGCLDLYSGRLRYANAGHDKPFLLTDTATLLPAKSNLPLGAFPGTEFEEQVCDLAPGDGLFLYTDGLTEAKDPGHENFGRKRVQDALEACLAAPGMTPEAAVRALSQAARRFAGVEPQSDDLTMLLIRFIPGDLVRDRITLDCDTKDVSRLSGFVKTYLDQLEMDRKTAGGLRLALEETVVNVMNYAYPAGEAGSVDVYADSDQKEVRFTVVDTGVPFDPTTVLSADTTLDVQNRPIGGLGILLTRKLTDAVSYAREQGRNVLTLTKSII